MWTTLAFVAALSTAPAQQGQLQLTNPRATFGVLGATRPNNTVLPGESFHIAFDIENLQANPKGEMLYSMGMEVINAKGVTEYKKDPPAEPISMYNILGGNSVPGFAHASTDPTSDAGEYTIKVTVVDGRTKKSATLAQKFTVGKKAFGIVDLSTSYDGRGGFPAPPGGVAGQSIWLNFWAIGFTVTNKKPNLDVSMRILDDKGQPTTAQPVADNITQELPADAVRIPLTFMLSLNRAGRFTVELTATDKNAGNTKSTVTFPLTVIAQK